MIKSKMLWLSTILCATGIAFGYIENIYYQYIDENDVLVETWFMPLSFLFIFLGGVGGLFALVRTTRLVVNKKT